MERERRDSGLRKPETWMLGESAVAQIFVLSELGWGTKQIAREVGIARNTVRAWLREGPDRQYGGEGRAGFLDRHYFWIQSRFQAGVRNADVLRQECEAMGESVNLRTVERALRPFRLSWQKAQQVTM